MDESVLTHQSLKYMNFFFHFFHFQRSLRIDQMSSPVEQNKSAELPSLEPGMAESIVVVKPYTP